MITEPEDEVLVIMEKGKIVRSAVSEVNRTGRATQGVTFASPDKGDRIIAVARNVERNLDENEQNDGSEGSAEDGSEAAGATAAPNTTEEDNS